jgi:DNA phosphorothioation-associated putative methyltransferase
MVNRERTAIKRKTCSRPLARALEDKVITRKTTVLDYGCGKGDDVRHLRRRRIKAEGWDPYYRPDTKLKKADIVLLIYVLNVIEDTKERAETLIKAFQLAKKTLVVGVRVGEKTRGIKFGNGCMTSINTFQKIYNQEELRKYIHKVLKVQPELKGGIAYVRKC